MVTTPIITSHNNERMKDEVGRERSDISDVASRRRAESFCYLLILSTVAAEPEPADILEYISWKRNSSTALRDSMCDVHSNSSFLINLQYSAIARYQVTFSHYEGILTNYYTSALLRLRQTCQQILNGLAPQTTTYTFCYFMKLVCNS